MDTINRVQELTQEKDLGDKQDLVLLTRKLRKYVDTKNGEVAASIKELVEQVKLLRQEQKSLKDYWDLQAASLRKDLFSKALDHFSSQDTWLNKKLELTQPSNELDSQAKSFNAGAEYMLKNLESLFKLLPAAQVVIPDGAVKVLQDAPNVHVTVAAPEKSFKVDVAPAIVNFPKEAVKFQVNVPEQPTPEVNVQVHNKPMKKTFEYYENGQPKHVIEEYLDDDD